MSECTHEESTLYEWKCGLVEVFCKDDECWASFGNSYIEIAVRCKCKTYGGWKRPNYVLQGGITEIQALRIVANLKIAQKV